MIACARVHNSEDLFVDVNFTDLTNPRQSNLFKRITEEDIPVSLGPTAVYQYMYQKQVDSEHICIRA